MVGQVRRDVDLPADGLAHRLDRCALVQRVEAHLAGLIEVVDAEVGDDDRRAAALPAALAPDAFGLLGAAQVAGARPEVDLLDEAAPALAHDHEHLPGVDRDLTCTAGPGQARLGRVVRADDRRVDVAEAIDLGRAQEPHVDQPALQVVAEQLEHAHDGGRARDDRRIADRQRQTRRPRPEHARLVDHLELRRDGPLGEVDRDVGQPDADETDALALEGTRGGHDHHLGLGERRLRHGTASSDV